MSYLPVGEIDCDETPDDEVCQVLHPTTQETPAAEAQTTGFFNDIIQKGVDIIKGGSTKVASTPSAGSSHTTLMVVGVIGAAGALWYLLRKKK